MPARSRLRCRPIRTTAATASLSRKHRARIMFAASAAVIQGATPQRPQHESLDHPRGRAQAAAAEHERRGMVGTLARGAPAGPVRGNLTCSRTRDTP
jgi:hypothetical protein